MSPARALWVGLVVFCAVAFLGVQVWADDAPAPAEKPAVEKPAKATTDKPAAPDKSDIAKTKAEKAIADATKDMSEGAEAEGKTVTAVLQADTEAQKKMKDKSDLIGKLERNDMSPGMKDYKAAYLGGAAQLLKIDTKYAKAKLEIQTSQRDAKILPDDVKGKLDETLTRVNKQRRDNFEKMGTYYETVADYKDALAVYVGIMKDIPADKRDGETTLKDKIMKLQAKLSPPKGGSGDTGQGTNAGHGKYY